MKILKIGANNFLSFKEFELEDFKPGLTLVVGDNKDRGDSNGSGKSAIWDAISWCLFGLTTRGLKNDDVVNRAEKSECMAFVEFEFDGHVFRVTRHRKSKKFANRLIVSMSSDKGEEIIEKSTVADTQDWLLNRLGVDYDLFRCTVLFAQGDTFNFVNETDKVQKDILGKIRRVDFTKALAKTRARIAELAASEVKLKSDIATLESHLTDDREVELKESADEWEKERRESLRAMIARLKEVEAEEVPTVKDSKEDIEKLEKIRSALDLKRGTLKERSRTLSRKGGSLASRIEELSGLSDTCPTCEQPVDKSSLKGKLAALKKESAAVEAELSMIESEMASAADKFDRVTVELGVRRGAMREANEKIRVRERNIANYRQDIAEKKAEENPFLGQLEKEKSRRKQVEAKLVELRKRLDGFGDDLPYLKFWEEAYSDRGIKSFLFDSLCNTLTERANKYLSTLSGGETSVSFDTQTTLKSGEVRERFECVVHTGDDDVPYSAYSGGEKTSISLSVDMALSDLMVDFYKSSFNLCVFDEQDLYLDRLGRQNYHAMLKEIARKRSVFVVSHDAELKGRFDSHICVEKCGGVSRIV